MVQMMSTLPPVGPSDAKTTNNDSSRKRARSPISNTSPSSGVDDYLTGKEANTKHAFDGAGGTRNIERAIETEAGSISEARFHKAQGRVYKGLEESKQNTWNGDFSFVQLADPQFGMLRNNATWDEEVASLKCAIDHLNAMRPKPKFVVVCGDLVNAFPHENLTAQANQVTSFKHIMSLIDKDIEPICLCGNHDVGNRPTKHSVELYKSRFGDDYFTFWIGGAQFIVLNSPVYSDDSDTKDIALEQDQWLDTVLAKGNPTHRIVFSHHPPFIYSPDEENGYFNLDPSKRLGLLDRMSLAGVSMWFTGHYHRNAGGFYRAIDRNKYYSQLHLHPKSKRETHRNVQSIIPSTETGSQVPNSSLITSPQVNNEGQIGSDIEVVVTGPVGCTIIDDGSDPLGLDGITAIECDATKSGFRIVHISRSAVNHNWVPLSSRAVEEVPESTSNAPSNLPHTVRVICNSSGDSDDRSDSGRREDEDLTIENQETVKRLRSNSLCG